MEYSESEESNINFLNNNINQITQENNTLSKKFYELQNHNNAAYGEYKQKHYLYNQLYIENIVLLCIIGSISGFFIYNIKKM